MSKIVIATDNIDNYTKDNTRAQKVVELLKAKGHTVTYAGVGANKVQRAAQNGSYDIMIQIVGGKCLGTLVDFNLGITRGYYKVKQAGFMYYNCWDANWKAVKAHDDTFSRSSDISGYIGKTLPEIFKTMGGKLFYGYGNDVESLVNTFINNWMGNTSDSTSSADFVQSGTAALDKIKEVTNEWDEEGIVYQLDGDTFMVSKANPEIYSVMNDNMILSNSITFTDYEPSTPNTLSRGGEVLQDNTLVERFGVIAAEDYPNVSMNHALQINKRDKGHSIELKCLISPYYQAGNWVKLTCADLGLKNELYYITKASLDGSIYMSVTLVPFVPSKYQELTSTNISTKGVTATTTSGAVNGVYTSSPHKMNKGGGQLGQINGYYCGPHALSQALYKFGIDIGESTLAGWAGTTTSGTGHSGLRTAVSRAASQSGVSLSMTEQRFSSLGSTNNERFKAIGEIISNSNKAVILHLLYKSTWGHYECVHKVNTNNNTITILNSLGSKCNSPAYCGSVEERAYSTCANWINQIGQSQILTISKT